MPAAGEDVSSGEGAKNAGKGRRVGLCLSGGGFRATVRGASQARPSKRWQLERAGPAGLSHAFVDHADAQPARARASDVARRSPSHRASLREDMRALQAAQQRPPPQKKTS